MVIGGTDKDDVSKVTVTDANGNIVPADISIDDSIDGKRVVKAHATAPHSGLYTLNVPQSAKPTGGDYKINDGSVACWNGDNGTGSLADCQTGNNDSVGKVTPTPDKVWVLDESGALVAEDQAMDQPAGRRSEDVPRGRPGGRGRQRQHPRAPAQPAGILFHHR